MIRRALALGCAAFVLVAPAAAGAVTPRASLPDIERNVMCVTCRVPLDIAESPQADRERTFISNLIDRGETKAQIEQALVAQYGPAVLALPSHHGFDLAAYLVPIIAGAAVLATLAVLLPRSRRRSGSRVGPARAAPTLTPGESARLDADLARFDR